MYYKNFKLLNVTLPNLGKSFVFFIFKIWKTGYFL